MVFKFLTPFISQTLLKLQTRRIGDLKQLGNNQETPKTEPQPVEIPQIPSFSNVDISYSLYSFGELSRNLLIYSALYMLPSVAGKADVFYGLSKRFLGPKFTHWAIEKTVFPVFSVSEDSNSIIAVVDKLKSRNVEVILNYSVEQDPNLVPDDSTETADVLSRKDRSKAKIAKEFLRSVELSKQTGAKFIAVKFSGMIESSVLYKLSENILLLDVLFYSESAVHPTDPFVFAHSRINFHEFWAQISERYQARTGVSFTEEEETKIWTIWQQIFTDSASETNISRETPVSCLKILRELNVCSLEKLQDERVKELLSVIGGQELNELDMADLSKFIERFEEVVKKAQESGVHILVDAEYCYLQPAIELLTINLQRTFNLKAPVVWNTFQCYTKRSRFGAFVSVELAKQEGWHWGGKLVRGAYIDYEARIAKENNKESPVWDGLGLTHQNYNSIANYVTENIFLPAPSLATVCPAAASERVHLMIATHNQDTLELFSSKIISILSKTKTGQERQGKKRLDQVFFGQIYGMSDHLTFNMSESGFRGIKYIAYGPVHEVTPFLIRRCQENSTMLNRVSVDLTAMRKALKNRLFSRRKD